VSVEPHQGKSRRQKSFWSSPEPTRAKARRSGARPKTTSLERPRNRVQIPTAPAAGSGARRMDGGQGGAGKEDRRLATLRSGGGVLFSPGGLDAVATIEPGAGAWIMPELDAELSVVVPLSSASLTTAEGTSRTRIAAVTLLLDYSLPFGSTGFVAELGAGASGLWLRTRGDPRGDAYYSRESDALALAPVGDFRLAYSLGHRLRLGLGGRVGASLPRFVLRHAGRRVATWGWPFTLAHLGAEVDLP